MNTKESESNGCLMRLTPFAVWAYQLEKVDLFDAVKLQTMMTHSNEIAIEAS
jgi:ADP-ribosylglycohydrolase